MKAYYFANSKLFGAYHPTKNPGIGNKGVVLCYPIGQEYFRSHRAYLQLAKQMNIAGLHVFRFDYYGTGDSLGQPIDWGVDQWVSNILSAVNELKLISGVDEVTLVGLRFGALLVALANQNVQLNEIVLWSPILSGKLYLDSLKVMQREILTSPNYFQIPRTGKHGIESEQLLGFPFPSHLKAAIQNLNLKNILNNLSVEIGLIVERERDDYSHLVASLTESGAKISTRVISDAGNWDGIENFETVITPFDTLSAITSLICGKRW
jgi:hypothetical protein